VILASGTGVPGEATVHRVWLSGGRDAPTGARAALDLITVEHFDETACADLRLLVSELVSNAVLHGGAGDYTDDIELVIELSRTLLRVECIDPVGGFDAPASTNGHVAVSGHGLKIVDSLSARWGTRHGGTGSTWFEFARAG
jgi:two-component sensor histidine kinase